MESVKKLLGAASEIEKKLGYTFKNRELLTLSFTHRTFANENREQKEHNERLEFVGDSVLGLIVAEHLYHLFPHLPEGELSYLRSRLVEAASCVSYLRALDVEEYFLLGKGEQENKGRGRESILSDLFEAIIGAIYLDGGIEAARGFFFGHFASSVEAIVCRPEKNWKALLQDYCQKKFKIIPSYVVEQEKGPDHSKIFEVSVWIQDDCMGRGSGSSKKEAHQAAALEALKTLKEISL